MMIELKRAYELAAPADVSEAASPAPRRQAAGARVLVDRLWPRGLRKDQLPIDQWAREVAPSRELIRWFGHDPAKWDEFRRRYLCELGAKPDAVAPLVDAARRGRLTLVFGARDATHNNAVVLREYLLRRLTFPERGH
ncbi:MAG: DUF488 family protein [bacterium]|nr:DUF488 family protein [bacterium]